MKRRQFLKQTAFGAAFFTTSGLFAEQLVPTARVGEGPFYPDKLPLDTDNDLLIINDSITPAVGQITHLAGRILNSSGQPIRNAFVEIWQCRAGTLGPLSARVTSATACHANLRSAMGASCGCGESAQAGDSRQPRHRNPYAALTRIRQQGCTTG